MVMFLENKEGILFNLNQSKYRLHGIQYMMVNNSMK